MTDSRERSAGKPTSRVVQAAVLAGASLLAGAIGYTAGRWVGYGELREGRDSFRVERTELEADLSSLRSELTNAALAHQTSERSSERRIQALGARRQLAMAIDELDLRNFGTATARLATASALLTSDLHSDAMRDLSADMAAAHLTVSDDLERARGVVRSFAGRLDAEIDVASSADVRPRASAAQPVDEFLDPRMVRAPSLPSRSRASEPAL